MKYIIKQLSDEFIFEEMEQVRKQFVEALNYTMESATVFFDENAQDPLDFYIAYDFQQKHGEHIVYGFNLRDEIVRNFKLDKEKYHSSKTLLTISRHLKKLADEIEERYDPEPVKTLAAAKEKKDAEYAKSINRSYREVLKEAIEKDKAERGNKREEFIEETLNQTILLHNKLDR